MAFPDIDEQLKRARIAQAELGSYSQAKIDQIVKALAWAIYRDDHAFELASIAVSETKLGNIKDKIFKNKRKTLGTLSDLLPVKTVGIVREDPRIGLTTYNKPIGVVGTLTPSTNPAATPANQALMAVKGANAIIVCPSPAGLGTAQKLKEFFDDALNDIGVPNDIFQVVLPPINFAKAEYLMKNVDLVLVTGDQNNVKKGYSSGTPCIGVGKGNVPVIIDSTANLEDAVAKIIASKTFDNSTSCSSESCLIVLEDAYLKTMQLLEQSGGYIASETEILTIEKIQYKQNNTLNRDVIGRNLSELCKAFNLNETVLKTKSFIVVPQNAVGPEFPLSGEKMSLVLSVYKACDFDEAISLTKSILEYEGLGHSVGIHTSSSVNARKLAENAKVARVLVNQAHTFANGGGANNALPFTLTMGCGSWAGNSLSENLSIKHFVNKTVLVETYNKETLCAPSAFEEFYVETLDAK